MDGRKQDITKNGKDSCAYFVSTVLLRFDLVKEIHATVAGTIKDLEDFGWFKLKKPKKGAVLVWEKKKIGESESFHIGFYLGNKKAISNSSKKGFPVIHHYTFGNKRKIIKILWNKKLGLQKISS